ncbi:hypothetical protein BGZ73_001074 [Actinomortierella ambigua]|nr:hypothetical protein BGZ73_001074 [Actinomortierella ambigua]
MTPTADHRQRSPATQEAEIFQQHGITRTTLPRGAWVHRDQWSDLHDALARYLNDKRDKIPVKDLATGEIDWNRVGIQPKEGAPKLRFQKIPADKNVTVEVVTKVAKFLTAFENFYSEAMTKDLFNEMGWRCMRLSLIDAELDEEYKKMIEASQDRSFGKVKAIVMDLTRLDNLMADLNKLVLSIALEPDEDHAVFCDRVKDLLDVAGSFSWNERVCQAILRALPEDGAQKVRAHFVGQGSPLNDPDAVLDFIRRNGHVCKGDPVEPTRWHIQKFNLRKTVEAKSPSLAVARQQSKRPSPKGKDRSGKRHDHKPTEKTPLSDPCTRKGCRTNHHEAASCWYKDKPKKWPSNNAKDHKKTMQAIQHLCSVVPTLQAQLQASAPSAPSPVVNALQANLEALHLTKDPATRSDLSAAAFGQRKTGQSLHQAYTAQQAAILYQPNPLEGVTLDDVGNEVPLQAPPDLAMEEEALV